MELVLRELQYLSPTSISLWSKNQEEFYLNYLSDNRPPRFAQTQPMSVGSAFDAYVKAFLHSNLFGADNDPKYGFEALFESQVEVHNRDWARQHGSYIFEQYKSSGSLADLMLELRQASSDPRFEFEVRGAVHGYKEEARLTLSQVTLLGKPDVFFINAHGCPVILDFKVNGYCSRNAWSPMPGYLRMRSAGKTNHGMHKKCQPMTVNGVTINVAMNLDDSNADWARQLSVYAWLCGEPVGSKFVTAIDQVVCDATKSHLPSLRFAEHRTLVSEKFQLQVFKEAVTIWEIVKSDHIFRNMSLEDSQARCAVLDGQRDALLGDGSSNDQWFAGACRG